MPRGNKNKVPVLARQNETKPAPSPLRAACASGPPVHAQQAKPGGSPLDTLMHTKIWADVPEAKDFVRETRPPPDSLVYQPVTGTDPDRPKLRSKAELEALANELE